MKYSLLAAILASLVASPLAIYFICVSPVSLAFSFWVSILTSNFGFPVSASCLHLPETMGMWTTSTRYTSLSYALAPTGSLMRLWSLDYLPMPPMSLTLKTALKLSVSKLFEMKSNWATMHYNTNLLSWKTK